MSTEKGKIYKITNLVNGLIYIGYTRKGRTKQWDDDKKMGRKK